MTKPEAQIFYSDAEKVIQIFFWTIEGEFGQMPLDSMKYVAN